VTVVESGVAALSVPASVGWAGFGVLELDEHP
jgi:hypothetical protein